MVTPSTADIGRQPTDGQAHAGTHAQLIGDVLVAQPPASQSAAIPSEVLILSALADMQGEVQPLDVVAFLWFAAQNAMKGPEADERLFRRDSIEFAATEVPEFKLKVLNREYPRLRGVVERLMEGHEGRSQSEAVAALGPEHRRLLQVLHFVKEIDGTYYVTPALSTILGLDMSDGEYHGRAVRLVIDAVIED